jgi:hypothetical protein
VDEALLMVGKAPKVDKTNTQTEAGKS